MIVINNQEEMKLYYNEKINTYEFIENNRLIDIKIDFDLNIECNIKAGNIEACNIEAGNINSWDINARDIKACDINADNIKACDIKARDINACNINAVNINAWDIKARNINSGDINACDIKADNIKANNIYFNAVCFARETFVCESIEGRRENSKYFCLDSDVVIKNQKS